MARTRPIVAIDGPSGAGKSTAARALARELGFSYVNTGALYRAVAIAARDAGIDPAAADIGSRLAQLLQTIVISFVGENILLDGREVGIDPAVGDLASRLSALEVVRARMRDLQRAAGADGGVVMEGRDIGTVIFPDAEFKFFLEADVNVRAARRFEELRAAGGIASLDQVLADLIERDRRDRERPLAPLRRADDAIVIDSTHSTAAQVVAALKAHIETHGHAQKGLQPARAGCTDRS